MLGCDASPATAVTRPPRSGPMWRYFKPDQRVSGYFGAPNAAAAARTAISRRMSSPVQSLIVQRARARQCAPLRVEEVGVAWFDVVEPYQRVAGLEQFPLHPAKRGGVAVEVEWGALEADGLGGESSGGFADRPLGRVKPVG